MKIFSIIRVSGAMVLTAAAAWALGSFPGQADFEFLNSPDAYLSQLRPNMTRRLFAPGIVSTAESQHSAPVVSPDGREIYWTGIENGRDPFFIIYFVRFENGRWTDPRPAPFAGSVDTTNPFFSPDGTRLFYCQQGPEGSGLMAVDRTLTGWSEPFSMGPVFQGLHYQGSMTQDGTIYFTVDAGNVREIYRSRFIDGRYQTKENLGPVVNSLYDDSGPFIAPDESYLIFSSNRPGGYGVKDLYISFRLADSVWTPPVNMGYIVNSGQFESYASVSPDGRYLFFTTSRDNGNTYWVSAQVISLLKRRVLGE